MAAVANFVGWRHKSRDSTPCNWNTWRFGLFCCYFRQGRCVNSLCQITERSLFFRISTDQPKRLLDQYIFGHTSLVTSVVYSSASQFPLDALIKIKSVCVCDISQMRQRTPMWTEYMFVIWSCIRTKGGVSLEQNLFTSPPQWLILLSVPMRIFW